MTLTAIAVFGFGAVLYKFIRARGRSWALLIGSILAIYWLQPALSVRPLDFALPTATLILGILGWLLTRQEPANNRENLVTLAVIVATVIGLAAIGAGLNA